MTVRAIGELSSTADALEDARRCLGRAEELAANGDDPTALLGVIAMTMARLGVAAKKARNSRTL